MKKNITDRLTEEVEKDIELRSEEVQDLLGEVPPWILRWGIVVLLCVAVLLLTGSYFFKYPDVVTAEITVTTANPPAPVFGRASGKIQKLYVSDKQNVKKGDYLAVVENSANTGDILLLKDDLNKNDGDSLFRVHTRTSLLQLGDIQSGYIAFQNIVQEYDNFKNLGYYDKKIAFQQKQINQHKRYLERTIRQDLLTQEQFQLTAQRWEKDSILHKKGSISGPEYNSSRSNYLQGLQGLESSKSNIESQQMQIAQLEEEFLNLQLEKLEKERELENNYQNVREQLIISLKNWEMQYVFTSPIDGQVTFTSYWSENHTINGGEAAFTVVPTSEDKLIGKALLPVASSGKVKEGQKVNIRFVNYPDQEFGAVTGIVRSISLVPVEENYVVEIDLPEGLKTGYGRILPLSQQMTGNADIITDDLSLLERFMQPMKKFFTLNK